MNNVSETIHKGFISKPFVEHQLVPNITWDDSFKDNPLLGWEQPEGKGWGIYTNFHIGADWLTKDKPIIVVPKMENIDFLELFMHCFSEDDSGSFSEIYHIDTSGKLITAPNLNSILSQLVIVRYLKVISQIIKKGLLKQYVDREQNLRKVKGRIVVTANDRLNVRRRNYEKVYCRFSEYSIDNPINGLLKRALIFCQTLLTLLNKKTKPSKSYANIMAVIGRQLSAFSGVDDYVGNNYQLKANKLYSEYKEAISLALQILRRYDNSISQASQEQSQVPPFWIDMSLLYEHYAYSLMKEAYGRRILYQEEGYQSVRPDFLYLDKDERYILDTKYMPQFKDKHISYDIERQLSGYARDNKILRKLGVTVDKINNINVPCVIIYPTVSRKEDNPFKEHAIKELLVGETYYSNFYTIALPLPIILL